MTDAFWTPLLASIVSVRAQGAFGSGWFAHPSGLVVTNHHVVGYLTKVAIRWSGAQEMAAQVIHADSKLDLAVLLPEQRVEVQPIRFGDSRALGVGDPVVAVGHPLGFDYTVTRGIISATRRAHRGVEYLQTDASLNPGNSGGPLIDRHGAAVGLNTWQRSDGSGLGFALPVHAFADLMGELAERAPALAGHPPRYACQECDSAIDPAFDRCAACGALIPYARRSVLDAPQRARLERAASALIASLGFAPNAASIGDGQWRLRTRTADLLFELDEGGGALRVAARLVEVPATHGEHFLRFMAAANDLTTRAGRLVLRGRVVLLQWSDPVEGFDVGQSKQRLLGLASIARELQSLMTARFQAQLPPIELDGRGAR